MCCCNAGHANQLEHCVQLKHGDTTWQVRKPNTIRLGKAIQEFMQHEAKASPDGRQYQALLADGSLVDTSLSIAALPLTPKDTVQVRWSAEAEGVHMSVRAEGRGASGAGQQKKNGNRMAQSSTRLSAVKQSAVPHTAAAAVPSVAASGPKAVQPVFAAADKGEPCFFFCPQTCFCWQLQDATMQRAVLQPVPDVWQCDAGDSVHAALCRRLCCLFLPPMPVTLYICSLYFIMWRLWSTKAAPVHAPKAACLNYATCGLMIWVLCRQ